MIRRADIIESLRNRGYEVEEFTVVKNGTEKKGIRFIADKGITPIIYTDEIAKEAESLDKAVEIVVNTYEEASWAGAIDFNVDNLKNPDYILQNLYIGLQKTSSENIVRKRTDFAGIEAYLYVKINENATFKLKNETMEILRINRTEAWKTAEEHTFSKTKITALSEIIGLGEEPLDGFPMGYVITNDSMFKGASAILDKVSLKILGDKLNVCRFIVLPSSIHEMIVIPDCGEFNTDSLGEMVRDINEQQVRAEERLTNRAYIMEL